MRIAFVGKGGSGKSTVTALFVQTLLAHNQGTLAIDADINVHLASALGVSPNPGLALSRTQNTTAIRQLLKGENERIQHLDHFIKTTPPATGSTLVTLKEEHPILRQFGYVFAPGGTFMHVGTYESDEIGTACYHTNLSIFENILSHTVTGPDEWLVADMVAGTDAFSNTLHAQFDCLALIVEPTPEGVSVYQQYRALAKSAGITDRLVVLGNKITDELDIEYLREHIGEALLGSLAHNQAIKRDRQRGLPVRAEHLTDSERAILEALMAHTSKHVVDAQVRLSYLYDLHRRYSSKASIRERFGDLTDQIDPSFHYEGSHA